LKNRDKTGIIHEAPHFIIAVNSSFFNDEHLP
jgi:hypothetical protein